MAWITVGDIMLNEKGKKMQKTTSSMIPFTKLKMRQDYKQYTGQTMF